MDEAVRRFQAALASELRNASTHCWLGRALQAKGDLDGATRCFDAALKFNPNDATARVFLGIAREARGDLLGNALAAGGDVEGAIRCYQAALAIEPSSALAHHNLGGALLQKGDATGAIRSFRAALAINPRQAEAHAALGFALLAQEHLAEARTSLQNALRLLPGKHPLRTFSAQELQKCEALLALGPRLPAILKGEAKPQDAAEGLLLAQFCQRYKRHYAAAARLYADAFAAEPKLAADLQQATRYNAACAAALAGCGRGHDAARLGMDERARLRRQALGWLRADLAARAKFLDGDPQQSSPVVAQTMKPWQTDPDLAGLRGADAFTRLPEAERTAWRQFWADVDGLRKQAAEAGR